MPTLRLCAAQERGLICAPKVETRNGSSPSTQKVPLPAGRGQHRALTAPGSCIGLDRLHEILP